nr:MAG TPA: hypothetical protein [Caudoviricetes sp.]
MPWYPLYKHVNNTIPNLPISVMGIGRCRSDAVILFFG